ncbi:MAG: DUF624 domain-containing protein [Bacillota bacterium]
MSAIEKRPPSWPLAFRSIVGGVKLAYEYLGLTLVHSLLWFACRLPFLMIAWSTWANLGASVPERGRLAYFVKENNRPVLVIADQNGKNATRILLEGLGGPEDPALSPDGKKVAFVEGGRLCLLEVEGGRWRVLRETGRAEHPFFGPDGRTIVFALAEGSAPAELYLMDIASGAETRLTETPVPETDPSFAPDGKSLAFVRPDEDGNEEIWVMKLVDGRPGPITQLTRTNPPVANRQPVFSPDGRKIAFCSSRHGRSELYLIMADGQGEMRLTENRLEEKLPYFSSTGSKVFFLADGDEGRPSVYFVPAQGGMERRLGESAPAIPWAFVFLLLVITGAFLAAPADAAMVFVSHRCGEDEPRLRDFFLGFKRYYLRSAAVYAVFLLLGGLLLANLSLALRMRVWFSFFSVILSLYTLLFLVVLSPHLFPLVVLQPNTFRKVWKKAFLLTLDNLLASGLFVLLTAALIAIAGFTGILLVLFYPAAIGHAARLFFEGLLAQYEEPTPAGEEAGTS